MTTHTLALPLRRPPLTSNDQRRAHWTRVRAAKAQVAELVGWHARNNHVPLVGRCTVTVQWYAPDARHRDADSLGPFAKAAIDGLKQCGVLAEDDARYVSAVHLPAVVVDRVNPRIEITLTEEAPECP